MCKVHSKVTHIKQQRYFHHLKGRGYIHSMARGYAYAKIEHASVRTYHSVCRKEAARCFVSV